MRYIKLIAKPNTWFKEGTEAYNYDCRPDNPKRITAEEYDTDWKPYGYILCRGTRISDGGSNDGIPFGEEYFDGESCSLSEFDIEYIEE